MSDHAAGDRALFIGKGFLGLGTAGQGSGGLIFRVKAFHDDPARGVVFFKSLAVPLPALVPATGRYAAGTGAFAAFDAAWAPYSFGGHTYDPFGSLGASLDRAVAAGDGGTGHGAGRWHAGIATALWAAMEGDLYRFAFDSAFTAALEAFRDTPEWKRFARLNDVYRACVKALVPHGIVPPRWSAWLREASRVDRDPPPPADRIERLLTRPVDSLIHAVVKMAVPGSLFSIPPLDPVES